jgi:hypothetical protein
MKHLRAFLQKHSDDILIMAGCGLILYGISLVSIPWTWVVAGIMCLVLAVLIGFGGRQ